MSEAKTLALLTSGGDAPGMNTALHVLTERAEQSGWNILGVLEGFQGLLNGDFRVLDATETVRYTRHGGTFLGSSRLPNFHTLADQSAKVIEEHGVTHLAVIGGNGSLRGAALLSNYACTAGLPGTIDNDVVGSELSIGFDTALNTGLALLDGMRDSAESLPRLFALETLGGDTGFLADAVARAGGADVTLIPENVLSETEIHERLRESVAKQRYALIVASEGYPELTGVLERASAALQTRIRVTRAGHAQRGGRPSAGDRLLAGALADAAFGLLKAGESGAALWQSGRAVPAPFGEAAVKPFAAWGGA